MAKAPIGQPIPVGDPSSLSESSANELKKAPSLISPIDALPSNIMPAQGLATQAEDAPALQTNPSGKTGWLDMMQIGWRLALMPAMAWSTYLTASLKAWEDSLQPQWSSRQ